MPAFTSGETGSPPVVTSQARALTAVVTRLRRVLRASIRTDNRWQGLPMAQVELLLALHDDSPIRVGELAARLRLAPNTVSGLIQVLVEAGLVARAADPGDRRVAVVTLTDAGGDRLGAWEQAHQQRLATALGRLPGTDQATVLAALPALARLVDQLADPAAEQPAPAEARADTRPR